MKIIISLLILLALIFAAWTVFHKEAVAPEAVPETTPVTEDTGEESSPIETVPAESGSTAGVEGAAVDTTMDKGSEADLGTTVEMVGTNYAYDVTEVRVQKGDTVTINFTSAEGFHDVVIDEFNVASDRVREGETTRVTFVADETGTFEYYCSVGNHRAQGMVGTLIVE